MYSVGIVLEKKSIQFVIDGETITDNGLIAVSFSEYFSNIGGRLANKVPRNNKEDYFQYLNSDVENFPGTFTFSSITLNHEGAVILFLFDCAILIIHLEMNLGVG